ncbi:hypothetical protein AB0I34_30015 [Kribbella sp. NPDC050281]|uniref:hypothetical protein n=1 Tax=Kribbella sp. NPDC050281 TaxID=3155515 RepID=UPI00340C4D80
MDHPSHREEEPLEPPRPSEPRPEAPTPAESPTPRLTNLPPDLEARMRQDPVFTRTGWGTEDRTPTPADSHHQRPAPDRKADEPQDAPNARPEHLEEAGPPDQSHRLPPELVAQMLKDPRFTRAGWGSDNDAPQPPAAPDNRNDTDPGASTPDQLPDKPTPDPPVDDTEPEAPSSVDPEDSTREGESTDESPAESTRPAPTDNAEPDQLTDADSKAPGSQPHDERTADNANDQSPQLESDEKSVSKTSGESVAAPIDSPQPETISNRDEAHPDVDSDPEAEPIPEPDSARSAEDPSVADSSSTTDPLEAEKQTPGELLRDRHERWVPEATYHQRPPAPDNPDVREVERIDPTDRDAAREEDLRNGVAYIADTKEAHPWLEPASHCDPVVQSVWASIDLTNGHGHIRHGPMGDDQLYADRVAHNEDPAQTDPIKRAQGIDGLYPNKQHHCARESTRIHDATAFAAAYLGALEHSAVKAAVDEPWHGSLPPKAVDIPIAELLGLGGHKFCSGFALKGDPVESMVLRKQWLQARNAGADLAGIPEPEAERIPSFEGGKIEVRFKANFADQRYELSTLYPKVRDDQS